MTTEAFHAGERDLQARAGVRERMAEIGARVLRDHMLDQHREFFAQLPFLVAGCIDAQGQPWASVLAGPPGFVQSPDPKRLRIAAQPAPWDPLAGVLAPGAPLGLLGIELPTRRRNRMNGIVEETGAQGFCVAVQQSFGNCPKYIQTRTLQPAETAPEPQPWSAHLDAAARALVTQADTFFIATAHPRPSAHGPAAHGVDVSHRGGRPGFVRVDEDGTLSVPDFAGNFFFNTLGNLALHPRAGLLFVDFARGDLLYVAATAQIVWDGPAVAAFAGAQRLLRLRPTAARRVAAGWPLRGGEAGLSPHLAATGRW